MTSEGRLKAVTISVFLLDDHNSCARHRAAVGIRDGIEVIGEAWHRRTSPREHPRLRPDAGDSSTSELPDGDGVTVCRDIRRPHATARLPMLTSYSDDEALFGAIMATARSAPRCTWPRRP
jgi:DNA-binding NarL/FixJ family response regulator